MADRLERELELLGRRIDYPPTPPLAPRVLAALAERPAQVPPRLARTVAIAAVLLLATAGTVIAASPVAREVASELLGLEGVEIERVPSIPDTAPEPPRLGDEVSLAEAQRAAGFRILVPTAVGRPDSVHLDPSPPGGQVTLAYRPRPGLPEARETGVGLLVSELRGDLVGEFVRKFVPPEIELDRFEVAGMRAVWIAGAPHLVGYRGPRGVVAEARLRLAANTLLLERGSLLIRIEGEISKRRAVEIAASLR